MEIIALNIADIETWYIIDAKTLEPIAKYPMTQIFNKMEIQKRETIDFPQMAYGLFMRHSIAAVTALGGKYLIMTAPLSCMRPLKGKGTKPAIGYIIVNTKTWEVEYRIPAITIKAASAIGWPQYSKHATNLEKLDQLFQDKQTIKKIIMTARFMNQNPAYWDVLIRPSISEDRYMLLALQGEWKIYDLKTGEWIGKEETIPITEYTIRRPMGVPRGELMRRLLAEYKIPEYVIGKTPLKWWNPEPYLLPKRLKLLITDGGGEQFFILMDPIKGEIENFTREGYGGWPLHAYIVAKEEGIMEEYEIPIHEPITDEKKSGLDSETHAYGPENNLAVILRYIGPKTPKMEKRLEKEAGPFLAIFIDEKGRVYEHHEVWMPDSWFLQSAYWWPKNFITFSAGEAIYRDGKFRALTDEDRTNLKLLSEKAIEITVKIHGEEITYVYDGVYDGSKFSYEADRVAYPLLAIREENEKTVSMAIYMALRDLEYTEIWGVKYVETRNDMLRGKNSLPLRCDWLKI